MGSLSAGSAALQKAFKSLPKSYMTYGRILASSNDDDTQYAPCLLQWLAFSIRTISLDDAIEVLATDPDADGKPLLTHIGGFEICAI